ncbi:hypothetical protein BMH32_09625 [Leucobacter sp. OLJS4]|uniref:hypothetical protein n=1 Tax=unclassified Leucobacter TaxID=2621730 RepID=UPI000C1894E7|nr:MULTISPECIES: hypothetical protein [unclassified Leucobacter]PIJ05611.1 hypothetical protein BMH30_14655 [Leucobacter sp. OLES1]PII83825.1 hypothetical protein BMH25_06910 [Leucobacter sp. OLCALW19]PII89358.1 hypothetical protein BMH26_03950 [Leucobacter sp. OLTLW20]PII90645.1 hypothetical protein BMH27_09810 [Leucobacter sp. OLAS13]PII98348.1 hypothetical protein BMH28_12890 [Leucobacter sp. OLCS4]
MTHAPTPEPAAPRTARIPLPGIVPVLAFASPLLLLLGLMLFGGTSSRRYFEGEPFQATLGVVAFLTGVGALLAVLVLVGIRTMLQRQFDLASETAHDRQPPRTDAR